MLAGDFNTEESKPCLSQFFFKMSAKNIVKKPTCFNDIRREKLCFTPASKNGYLAASGLFHMFTLSIKFYTFCYDLLKSTDV